MTQTALLEQVSICMSKFRGDRLRYQFTTHDFLPDKFPPHLTREAEAASLVAAVREHDPLIVNLIVALEEARNYIDGEIDVVDGDYGEPRPNRAMNLATKIAEAIAPFDTPTEG